jgi:hypothetical protein
MVAEFHVPTNAFYCETASLGAEEMETGVEVQNSWRESSLPMTVAEGGVEDEATARLQNEHDEECSEW